MVENKISNILIVSIVDRNPNSDRFYSFLGTECNLKILTTPSFVDYAINTNIHNTLNQLKNSKIQPNN